MNETMKKFGYPRTLIHAYDRWAVLLRPRQVTLGSLVMVCGEPARRFSEVSREGFVELDRVIADVERVLGALFEFDRINYLMLMMVDPDVHFHVIPRYERRREFGGASFEDASWPGPPDLGRAMELSSEQEVALVEALRDEWAP